MNILVTGASSQIGKCLLPMLDEKDCACTCISRKGHLGDTNITWLKADMTTGMMNVWQEKNQSAIWIHLGFLPLATSHLKAAFESGIKRFIGFSSTSVITKKDTDSGEERLTIQRLLEAEKEVQSQCETFGIAWTLFRPTMIYGYGMDQNIAFIQSAISRFGMFPLAGKTKGLRQPVHAEDLAKACVQVLQSDNARNKVYNLSGGEVLSYHAMVERVFRSMNREPRIICVPPSMYKLAITLLKLLSSRYAFVQTTMVDRMNIDMAFDHSDAKADFDYSPRAFQP